MAAPQSNTIPHRSNGHLHKVASAFSPCWTLLVTQAIQCHWYLSHIHTLSCLPVVIKTIFMWIVAFVFKDIYFLSTYSLNIGTVHCTGWFMAQFIQITIPLSSLYIFNFLLYISVLIVNMCIYFTICFNWSNTCVLTYLYQILLNVTKMTTHHMKW